METSFFGALKFKLNRSSHLEIFFKISVRKIFGRFAALLRQISPSNLHRGIQQFSNSATADTFLSCVILDFKSFAKILKISLRYAYFFLLILRK